MRHLDKASHPNPISSKSLGSTLDSTLAVLRDIARLNQVPEVSTAAGLALAIYDNTRGGEGPNEDAFECFASDTCGLVVKVIVYSEEVQIDGKLSNGLINHFQLFCPRWKNSTSRSFKISGAVEAGV